MAKINVKDGYVGFDFDIKSANLQSMIDKNIERINEHANELKMMAIADPKSYVDTSSDVIYEVKRRVDDAVESIGYLEQQIAEYQLAEYLIDEWRYEDTVKMDEKLNPDNETDFNKIVFTSNNETYNSPKYDRKTLGIRNYSSIDEYVGDCEIDLKHQLTTDYNCGWVIYLDGKLLVQENRRFTYLTREDAENAFIKYLGINLSYSMFNKRYIEENQNFIQSIRDTLTDNVLMLNKFNEIIASIQTPAHKYDMDESIALNNIFIDVILSKFKNRVSFENILEKKK